MTDTGLRLASQAVADVVSAAMLAAKPKQEENGVAAEAITD
jgi:hypothetical protein